MSTIQNRCHRAIKNPRLIAFIVCCLMMLIYLFITLLTQNDDMVLFAVKYCPFLAVSALFVVLLSPIAAATINVEEEIYLMYSTIVCGLVPWMLSIASAVLGTVVRKQWHLLAIIVLSLDMILSLATLRIIAMILDLALLILVCTTSSSADFWDV